MTNKTPETSRPWRVIIETCCPCEPCAGEQVTEPEIIECDTLGEAFRAYLRSEPEDSLFREVGPTETDGTHSFRSFSRSGQDFASPCPFCGQDEGLHWRVSLHPPAHVTEATRRRLAKLLGVEVGPRWILTYPADPFRPEGPLKRKLLATGQDPKQAFQELYEFARVHDDWKNRGAWTRRFQVCPDGPMATLSTYATMDRGQA